MKADHCSLPREAAVFKSSSYSVAHHLCTQAHFHCILCHSRQVGTCDLVGKAENILFVPFVYI